MTTNEDEKMSIANCRCCLLASYMKDCGGCPFKIGLEIKEIENESPIE